MNQQQHNTYTIQGLRVPELEQQIADLKESVSNIRTLIDAATEAIVRVDADVALILEAMSGPPT